MHFIIDYLFNSPYHFSKSRSQGSPVQTCARKLYDDEAKHYQNIVSMLALENLQLQSEIAHLDVAKRQKLLTGAELPIIIPAEQTLAMKADLGIPWAKLRIVNR